MKLYVGGDNDCAKTIRGYLSTQFAIIEAEEFIADPKVADFVLYIEIDPTAHHILFDSIDCPLEKNILRHTRALTSTEIKVMTAGGVQSETECRIVVPSDRSVQSAVEYGVLRGMLDLRKAGERAISLIHSPSQSAAEIKPMLEQAMKQLADILTGAAANASREQSRKDYEIISAQLNAQATEETANLKLYLTNLVTSEIARAQREIAVLIPPPYIPPTPPEPKVYGLVQRLVAAWNGHVILT